MLTADILNSDAQLNNFKVLNAKEFIPGEQFTLVFRLRETDLDLRFVPPATAKPSISLVKTDGTILTKTEVDISVTSDDRSIMSVVLSELESADLAGGNIQISLDLLGDGTEIKKGHIQNGLSRILVEGC